jgi:2-iminoacetate synthase ThiH
MTVSEIMGIIKSVGKEPFERDSLYNALQAL